MASGRSTSETPTAAIAFDFISARIAAARSIGKETATPQLVGWQWGHSTHRPFSRLATRSGKSRCIHGWSTSEDGASSAGSAAGHMTQETMRKTPDLHHPQAKHLGSVA